MLPALVTWLNYDKDTCVLVLGYISSVVSSSYSEIIIHFVDSILQKWKFTEMTNFNMVSH